jgi:hypothetical protein
MILLLVGADFLSVIFLWPLHEPEPFLLRYDCLSSVAYISNALHYQNQIIETCSICRSDVTLQNGAHELGL